MSEMPDIEVARYALRTFNVTSGRLMPVVVDVDAWKDGVCEARCEEASFHQWAAGGFAPNRAPNPPHGTPSENCSCGIYGCLTIEHLKRQYLHECMSIVTVIAVEGTTIIGDVGLRTQAARIVAYWSPRRDIRKMCAATCVGAVGFIDLDGMLTAYGFEPNRSQWPPLMSMFLPPPRPPRRSRFGRILFWLNIACIVVNLASLIAGLVRSAETSDLMMDAGMAVLNAVAALLIRSTWRKAGA